MTGTPPDSQPVEREPAAAVQVSGSENVAVASGGGTATVNVYNAPPPLDPQVVLREDVAAALAVLGARNVLYATLDAELWRYVFDSLHGLRDTLTEAAGKVRVRGPHDVRETLQFMVKAISTYLADHESGYLRYLDAHGGFEPGWAHTERDWLLSVQGRPAEDLLLLRQGLDTCVQHLNAFVDADAAVEWNPSFIAQYWADWAKERRA